MRLSKTLHSRDLVTPHYRHALQMLSGILILIHAFAFTAIGAPQAAPNIKYAEFRKKVAFSLMLDVVVTKSSRIVAVGERGHVLLSDDQGNTWRQAKSVPTRTTLTATTFADGKKGWAVGHDTIVLGTTDGGENWTQLHYDPEKEQPLLDVLFLTATHGIAIGTYGLYLETQDGGKTWEDRYIESLDDPDFGLPHFNTITLTADKTLYIAGEAGMLAKSMDLGKTWEKVPTPYNGSYFSLIVTKKNTLIAGGLRGNIYRSTDSGKTWQHITTQIPLTISSGVQTATGKIIFVGIAGVIYESTDDGATFQASRRRDRLSISAIAIVDNKTYIHAGLGGVRRVTQ